MSNFDQTVRAAAERSYAKHGERHSYSGLTYGLAAVVSETVPLDRPLDISSLYHDPLAGLADHWASGRFSTERVVEAMDERFGYGVGLSYELESVLEGRAFSYLSEPTVDLRWIKEQWEKNLKAKKIRRGSVKYKEEVSTASARVLDAALESAQRAAEKYEEQLNQQHKKIEKLHDAATEAHHRFEYKGDILHALLNASGLDANVKGQAARERLRQQFEQLFARLGGLSRSLESPSVDPQYMAIEALRLDPELQLFLQEQV